MRDPTLQQRLQSFRIGADDATLTFTDRLACEHRWTREFAERVVAEYLRFVYLAMVADTPVTPSVAVDQAWHLHLCYTRSYWEELCRDLLPRPLHHGPTRGGHREADKFNDWYERTLALYAAEFGAEPPRDIWPPAAERFAPAAQPVSVATRDFWVIEKRFVRRVATVLAVAGAAVPVWIGAKGENARALTIIAIVVGVFVLWAIVHSSARRRSHRKRTNDGGCGTGCGADSGCGGGGGCSGGGCGGGD